MHQCSQHSAALPSRWLSPRCNFSPAALAIQLQPQPQVLAGPAAGERVSRVDADLLKILPRSASGMLVDAEGWDITFKHPTCL